MESGIDYSSKEARQPEVMDKLRSECDRMERLITDLGNILQPVMVQYPIAEAERPMEEPYHDYHNLVLRFARLNDHLGAIVQGIKL